MPQNDSDLKTRLLACEEALKVERSRRLSAEVTLRETRQRFRKALKSLPVIIYATDQDGSLIFYNREFERVSGYAADDLQNAPGLLDLLLREDEGLCMVNDVTCRKWKIETKDGREKVVAWSEESSAVPLSGWRSWKIGLDITELETVREKVKILQGLLPICASCKQIRDAKGVWTPLETYIAERSEADFTHGICPACLAKLYPKTDSDT
jgi:PAS domain S-box-containing protein